MMHERNASMGERCTEIAKPTDHLFGRTTADLFPLFAVATSADQAGEVMTGVPRAEYAFLANAVCNGATRMIYPARGDAPADENGRNRSSAQAARGYC